MVFDGVNFSDKVKSSHDTDYRLHYSLSVLATFLRETMPLSLIRVTVFRFSPPSVLRVSAKCSGKLIPLSTISVRCVFTLVFASYVSAVRFGKNIPDARPDQFCQFSSGPHHQDSGEAKIRESTAGVSRKPSSDCKACGCSSKHLCGLTCRRSAIMGHI